MDGSEPRLIDPAMIVNKNEDNEYVFTLQQFLLFLKSFHFEHIYLKDDACSVLNDYCKEKHKMLRELKEIYQL